AAQVTAALGGFGDFTGGAGYLFNEGSGDLSSVFGTPSTLTAGGTPTYGNPGARGGADKAVGFDSGSDVFSGGNYFNVGPSDDLIVVWCSNSTGAGNGDFVGKWRGYVVGWELVVENGAFRIGIHDAQNFSLAWANA